MAKVRVVPLDQDQLQDQDGIGPLPDGPEDLMDGPEAGSDSRSTGSGSTSDVVEEAFAGDLIGLPFEAAHIIYKPIDPLTQSEKDHLAAPFAEILNKYNLGGKLSKAEILFGFYLTAAIAGRVRAVGAYQKQKKVEAEQLERSLDAETK